MKSFISLCFAAGLVAVSALPVADEVNANSKAQSWTVGQPVKTTSGWVTGEAAPGALNVSAYLGIPYAQPPLGDLRFAAPRKYRGNGNITATKFVSFDLSFISFLFLLADMRSLRKNCTILLALAQFLTVMQRLSVEWIGSPTASYNPSRADFGGFTQCS
jgi:hypothetical protein